MRTSLTRNMTGWTPYYFRHPPTRTLLRFRDEESGREWTGYDEDVRPFACDPQYLVWKMTGIARWLASGRVE